MSFEEEVLERLGRIEKTLAEQRPEPVKDWYSTDELAAAVKKSSFTVREKWCNGGRIECEKDPYSGKWRIPGHEFQRLVNGGSPRQPSR